jgi:phospholipid/cholesterol/gamma-HCH transport system permease protein
MFALNNFLFQTFFFLGGLSALLKDVIGALIHSKLEWKTVIDQIYHMGLKALPLVMTTSFSIGMVLTLQSGMGLSKFGGQLYLPKAVTLSILWELGPLFTGLMFAARSGAGMTSEIASMMVTQQIDAMRALGTSPIRKIVVPRVISSLICLPILVAVANGFAILGSVLIGYTQFNIDPIFYIQKILLTTTPFDYLSGFSKSFSFALFVSLPACYFGLSVREGAKELGIATTKSVVVAFIFIFIGDIFLTKLAWLFQ